MTQEFLEEFGKQMDRHELWSDWHNEACKLLEKKESAKALMLLEKAYEITDEGDIGHLTMCVERLAYTHYLEGNFKRAERYYKLAIEYCNVDPMEYSPLNTKPIPGATEEIEKIRLQDMARLHKTWIYTFKHLVKHVLADCQKSYCEMLEKQGRIDDIKEANQLIEETREKVNQIPYVK